MNVTSLLTELSPSLVGQPLSTGHLVFSFLPECDLESRRNCPKKDPRRPTSLHRKFGFTCPSEMRSREQTTLSKKRRICLQGIITGAACLLSYSAVRKFALPEDFHIDIAREDNQR